MASWYVLPKLYFFMMTRNESALGCTLSFTAAIFKVSGDRSQPLEPSFIQPNPPLYSNSGCDTATIILPFTGCVMGTVLSACSYSRKALKILVANMIITTQPINHKPPKVQPR